MHLGAREVYFARNFCRRLKALLRKRFQGSKNSCRRERLLESDKSYRRTTSEHSARLGCTENVWVWVEQRFPRCVTTFCFLKPALEVAEKLNFERVGKGTSSTRAVRLLKMSRRF
jgi:hypothetical protein